MKIHELGDFNIKAFDQYTPYFGNSMETGEELQGITNWIPAKVPGSVYSALSEAGLIEDPFIDMNSLKCEWVPERWWMYKTSFAFCPIPDRHYRLRIDNIDYTAHIWLNHQKLGESSNIFVPFISDITSVLRDENELIILLEHAPKEHGQIGYTSRTHTQKPRFSYKWDWCARMIGIGIDSPVIIEEFGCSSIESIRTEQTFPASDLCLLSTEAEFSSYESSGQTVDFELTLGQETVACARKEITTEPGANSTAATMEINSPRLWWPSDHGKQPLYKLKITIRDASGVISDEMTRSIGLRSVVNLPCEGADQSALPYKLNINGKDIYIKGVNYLPPEMQQGDIPYDRYYSVLKNIKEAHCNLIRVWGGAYIGSDTLYDICDELGIMVWQEFNQSSSGLDNVPSKDPLFLKQLADTAITAVRRLRTHPSLILYSGGNELMDSDSVPSDFTDANIALLKNIVSEHDSRFMLPTSASGPREYLDPAAKGKNHDVHGPWKYTGVTGHYELYNNSDSMLHSEFGVDGAANLSTLKRILSEKHLRVVSMRDDIVWRHRGEWWDTYDRTQEIFGNFMPDDLEIFVICSQYIQAEGLRYALEANRRRAFQNCGSIIWQYNEPYPNASGNNLEDYYGLKKLAYHYVRSAYRPLSPTLRYDKLIWEPGEKAELRVVVVNDSEEFTGVLRATVSAGGSVIYKNEQHILVKENTNLFLTPFEVTIPEGNAVRIELNLENLPVTVSSSYILFINDRSGFADRNTVISEYKAVTGCGAV